MFSFLRLEMNLRPRNQKTKRKINHVFFAKERLFIIKFSFFAQPVLFAKMFTF